MKRFITSGEALRIAVHRGLEKLEARGESAGRGVRRGAELAGARWRDLRGAISRNRRHPIMLVIAAVLMAPPGLAMLSAGSTEIAAFADGNMAAEEVGASLSDKLEVAREIDGDVANAWRARAMERERVRVAERFAREFSISPELAGHIYAAAREHEIQPEIAFGLVRAESSFRRTVVSHAGAVGYTQLLPSTARWIAPGTTRAALFDTETNLRVGFRYLRFLKDKYDGNVDLALTAYNRGQGNVDRLLRAGRNPDNGYAAAVRTGKVSQTLKRQNSPRS